MAEETKNYQLTCFLSPFLKQEELNNLVQRIKKLIIDQGGTCLDNFQNFAPRLEQTENPWQKLIRKVLAFPIKKHREAFYFNFDFTLASQAINELFNQLNLEKDILRYMINIKKETKPAKEIIDQKIIDQVIEKIEPMREKPAFQEKPASPQEIKGKLKIEELDKKLEEILKE